MIKKQLKDLFFDVKAYSDDSYLHSFLYYKITGRKGAWVYKDEESCVVVCQHPHKPQTLMVFPEIGEKTYDLTASVLQSLYRWNHEIQLSRYTQEDYESLKISLAKQAFNFVKDLHVIEEKLMDWRYPAHIYDTKRIAEMDGADFEYVRNKYRKLDKINIQYRVLNKDTAIRDMRSALRYWEGSMIAEGKETEGMSEFYLRFFELLQFYDGPYEGLLFFDGRRPLGFAVWDQINSETANSFINLADISVTGLSEFQTVTLCQYLQEKGVKYLNVGGSETQGLDKFKRKFKPYKSFDLMSIQVEYKQTMHPKIRMEKFV